MIESARDQTFRIPAPRPDIESACHRALRNVDWQELPTDTLKIESPGIAVGGDAGSGLIALVVGELLIGLLASIPFLRQRFARVRTRTLVAPTPPPGSDVVLYGVWGRVVMVTISLRDREGDGTEVTIAGQGGLAGKAAAVVWDLRHSIEIHSGLLNPSRRPPR